MKKMLVAVSLIVVAVSSGCDKDSAAVAKVNGAKITVADFKRQAEELPPQNLTRPVWLLPDSWARIRKKSYSLLPVPKRIILQFKE